MNLISFISIGVITLIGIFTFPLLGKIEDRKISVLKFFNMLNIEQITELVQQQLRACQSGLKREADCFHASGVELAFERV